MIALDIETIILIVPLTNLCNNSFLGKKTLTLSMASMVNV